MEASDILTALEERLAIVPGGRDEEGRPLIIVTVPPEGFPWNKENLDTVLKYLVSIFSAESRRCGLSVIIDAHRGAWRLARSCLRQVTTTLGTDVAALIMVRPDAFWDKQRVDNCAKIQRDGEHVYIPISRLPKYVSTSQLPEELGGTWVYNHHQWIQTRIFVERFTKDAEGSSSDLEKLRLRLTAYRAGLRASSAQQILTINRDFFDASALLTQRVFHAGKELLQRIELDFQEAHRRSGRESTTPQDLLDSRDRIDRLLEVINVKQGQIEEAWTNMEKHFVDTREVNSLEDGVSKVTNWILGPAETMLNGQKEVGFDLISAEELRQEHEKLELQCRETYGHYAELLHKIDTLPQNDISLPDDLKSQRDFMNFVFRSFATRLERRRNVLITSLRFFRLVSEYFDRTSEVFETLVKRNSVDDFETAENTLQQLQENQINIDFLEYEVMREGEKLADILSMPVKDALGRDVLVNYENDIVNVHDILDATVARKNIFCDSLDLQKLTLEQVTHIYVYEADAAQAVQWLDDLFQVLLKAHVHVGCNVYEIQNQKDEHQNFQETAKGTYEYGGQLLTASLALRQSCKLPIDVNNALTQQLWHSWKRLQTIGQEQMTRLRVSAVFHRSVEEHCNQLKDLMDAVKAMCATENVAKRRSRIHKFLTSRERLLLEVGRMVRLGRLLRTRLREPLCAEQKSDDASDGNATAVEAISDKLAEVTGLAEQLDVALCGAQGDGVPGSPGSPGGPSSPVSPNIKRILDGTASSTPEEWYSSIKSSSKSSAEDSKSEDEFVTASECTCTPPSRSSSFHTASECGAASPWWELDRISDAEDERRTKLGAVKSPVKTTTEITSDIVVHEITEKTRVKLSHTPIQDLASYLQMNRVARANTSTPQTTPSKSLTGESAILARYSPANLAGERSIDDATPCTESDRTLSTDDELLSQLIQSREYLQLKVLEVTPDLTQLGATLEEAEELQKAHDDVLQQLQSKQSPVEELLRQADHLISTQKPRADVYAAMAESLGLAWQDVNAHLDQRKHILDLNVAYQSRAEECNERMRILNAACQLESPPVDISQVKQLLTKIHDLKRAVLESLMATLQDGKALLETLKAIANQGSLDSRPDRIKSQAQCAVTQVELWLEALHDRRRLLDVNWQSTKTQLEQCLALALLASDLRELEDHLNLRREALLNSFDQLGNSSSSAELLLYEHIKLLTEAREMQDRALKITKATEQIVGDKHFAGDHAIAKSYEVLQGCAEYFESIEQRETMLTRAIAFFHLAHAAQSKLDQLEVQLTSSDVSHTSSQLAQIHSAASRNIVDITEEPIQEGYNILEAVGRGATGVEGVKNVVEDLENRKIHLEGLCTAHKEESLRVTQALTTFLEDQNTIFSWLVSVAEAFLQGHQDMGSVLAIAEDFLDLHVSLLKDLQKKGAEINALLLTLPPILECLNDEQRRDVDEKVDNLHSHWMNLKCVLEARIDLATEYVKFHKWAVKLANAFDEVDELFRATEGVDEDTISRVEQQWLQIQQLYGQLSNLGKSFIEEAAKVTDPYLDVKRACLCIDTLLEHFAGRQLTIESSFHSWQTTVTHEREYKILWERNVTESHRTIDWVSKLDNQLYPILTGDPSSSSKTVARELEDKLNVALPEVKRALAEIELRLRATETLTLRSDSNSQNETFTNKLNELHSRLQDIFTEYQILLQMLISFFKNLADLDKTIDLLESQYRLTNLPPTVPEIQLVLKEHEASRQAIQELFKFTNNECQQIIVRIRDQEPADCAPKDIERLTKTLELKRKAWESAWTDRKMQLEQHSELCHFDGDLQQINTALNDLGRQLNDLKGQYGESLVTSKATSSAFVFFEKTIELLEVRIQTFLGTAESLLSTQHASSPHIEREVQNLQARWAAFRRQVLETRRLINLSTQYFTLVEEAEEWFRSGSKLLVTIARKATGVKTPEEATQLLNDVEVFLKPGEAQQDERIKKISRLAVELYGEERSKQVNIVVNETREMRDSFTSISEELIILTRNLTIAEEQRKSQKKEQEDLDASLAQARAEAEAAKAAATAAEEARKAAEAVATALRDAVPPVMKTVDVGVEAMPITPEPKQKSPTPPPKVELPKPEAPMFIIPLHDSNILEGERFTFECSVTGIPKPDVIWYKDGMSIQNNPDYLTSFVDGRCSLTIEETFTEDSAKFTCTAGNIAGLAETSATLSVRENEPDEILSPPVFTKHLHPSTAKEGSAYYLECKVEGNPLPTVQWFKNGNCVDSSPDYSITYNNGEGILRFEEVFLEDQAEYSCRAINQMGSATSTANLNVEPLEPTEAPSFTTPLTNVMARAGQKIKLDCEVTGLPVPELSWSHNGKPIKETRDVKVHFEDQKASLVIGEAFPNDAGVYTVAAKNLAGEATSTCNVSVKGRLPTETSDSELASDMEPIKPAIQLQLKNLSVFEGASVQLDCIIIGQPEPEVIWYHDNRPVKESPEFKLLFQGDRCSLVIQEVFLEDAGDYKVTAINSGGEASSSCNLTVTSVNPTEPVSRSQASKEVEQEIVGSPPKFSKLLTDILVPEGDKVCFECCVTGDPRPDIRWFLNNGEIQPKERMEFGEDEEGNVSLTILEVSPSHKGVYTVKASNSLGEAKCFATLIVKASPTQTPESKARQVEDVSVAPSFRELFADRNVYEDEATKFECIVHGKPTPKVKWCFNDEPVAGSNFLVSTSGERQVLTIPKVTKDLVGKISCVAENDAGKAACVAILKIMRDADSPIEVSSVTEQIGSTSFTMKRSVFVQSSSSHVTSSSTTLGGGDPNVHVHSFSTQSQESLLQDGNKPPVQSQSTKIHEFRQINQETPEVREESFVKISNGQGTNEIVPLAISPPKATRKSVAPRFMTPLNGKIVDQGTDVVFEGIIDGYPAPEVSWTKNGVDLQPDGETLTITWALNKARMELKDANVKDAGRYTCKAVNEVGSASSTADLVVKKTVFPPVFGRRLQAQMAKVGERVNMEVEVTGTPEPTVTWYKDGQQILGSIPGSMFRTKMQGNCYTLIIEKALPELSGKYMVRAVNAGGEAQSIADFVVYEPQVNAGVEIVQHLVFEDVVHHTSQNTGPPLNESKKEPKQPEIVPNTLSFAPLAKRSYSPFTIEAMEILESTKSEQLTINSDHRERPVDTFITPIQEQITPVVPEEIKAIEIPVRLEDSTQVDVKEEVVAPTEPEIAPPVAEVPPQTETNGVETGSISKKSAFDFFLNKMHENDEPKPEEKKVDLPSKLPPFETVHPTESIVHKREPSFFGDLDFHATRPQYGSPVYALQPAQISSMNFPPEQVTPSVEFTSQTFQSTSSTLEQEEFFLQPEPPPEMGYSPKPERQVSVREDVTSRVKRLEEATKILSPVDIPMGAVRIFPIKLEPLKQEVTSAPPVNDRQEVVEETFIKEDVSLTKSYLTGGSDTTIPLEPLKPWDGNEDDFSSLPWVSAPDKPVETLVKPVEPPVVQPAPILRPQAEIAQRPTTPRPSAEAVSMEKMWASRRTPEPELVKPFEPITREPEPIRPITPKPQTFTTDNSWSSTLSTSHKFESFQSSNVTEDIKRAASPRPSAEGVSMEKLWTPRKPVEIEPIILKPLVPGHHSDKPSVEGLKMDKIWAHKHKDSSLKRSWPPQECAEDEKPILPWTPRETERIWPPVETKVSLTHKEVKHEVEVVRDVPPEPIQPPQPVYQPPKPVEPPKPVYQAPKPVEPPKQPAYQPPQPVYQAPKPTEPPKPIYQAPKPVEPPLPIQQPTRQPAFKAPEPIATLPAKVQPFEAIPSESTSFQSFRQETNESSVMRTSFHEEVPTPQQQHYFSESRVSHSSSMPETDMMSSTSTSFQETKSSHFESSFHSMTSSEEVDRNIKPSEAKLHWPPNQKDEFVLKAPPTVQDVLLSREPTSRPQSIQLDDIVLEPGSPPEFGVARAPLERRLSYKETVEQELEKDLKKEPSRVPFGSVRIIPPSSKEKTLPPPLPPKDQAVVPPPIPAKAPVEVKQITRKEVKSVETKFERFPDLEPFPYKAEPGKPKQKLAPPPKPSKFKKGEFGASDYDSDMESTVILPRWRPYESDTEDNLSYRKVKAPSFTPHASRPRSTDPEPLPPSKFDNPPTFEGPPRPIIEKVKTTKETKSETKAKVEVKAEKVKKHHHHHHHHQEEKRKVSPPNLKPGSPPVYVQAAPAKQEPKKVESPSKIVSKQQDSGYMADTDEPRLLMKQSSQKSTKQEETSVKTTIEHFTKITENFSQQSSQSTTVSRQAPVKPQPVYQSQHRKQESSSQSSHSSQTIAKPQPVYQAQHTQVKQKSIAAPPPAKVLVPSPIPQKDERPSSLEPFPYSVEPSPPVAKRPMGPPPPSPSKFHKGEYRESDYESDYYDSRIPPRWRPDGSDTDGPMFKPVRPVLTPSQPSRASVGGRTPTPPTEFDNPPQSDGPPRPKFTPIEKQPVVKREEVLKPTNKQPVFKPKPVAATCISPMETIIATPAVKDVLFLKPGSPPEMGFAPRTQKSSPYHNATQTETSNVVNFAESTEHSHRVVSVQQTTRIIKFGDKENKPAPAPQLPLEPFPFKPDPVTHTKRNVGPPPTTPKKFVKGEFRESDYESDVEAVHFKPKWTPGDSDTDGIQYRKVQAPTMTRSSSVPERAAKVPTPMEFDTAPPYLSSSSVKSESSSQVTTRVEVEAEQNRLRRVEEMRQRFGENKGTSLPSKEIARPAAAMPASASYAASKHMNEMTSTFKSKAQQFVNDIITDVESSRKPDKPILKAGGHQPADADEPQAYREESRLAEYGTKHIDPDTGLIYFKYDFGYEFGIVLPGEGSKDGGDKTKKRRIEEKRSDDVDFPVIHEKTNKPVAEEPKQVPQFRPKKFTHFKSVKWDPMSESEMSETEDSMQHKKRYSLPQPTAAMMQREPHIMIPNSGMMSPSSTLSPSLPSLSPYCSSIGPSAGGSPWSTLSPVKGQGAPSKGRGGTPTPPSTPSTPRSSSGIVLGSHQLTQPRKPPTFITPLRDIAVVSGQSARFECIVQAEPPPNIIWSSNGRILENSNYYQIEFRNGVCRLTIPQAFTEYAGSYTCTATNMLGTAGTSASLQVPGEKRFRK